jgi:hypothetical protein
MSPARHSSRGRKLSVALHRWHRRIGAVASLFVIWLIISGWLLNHTAALGLGHRVSHAAMLARVYDLKASDLDGVYVAGQHWLANTPDALILDGRKIDVPIHRPLGLATGDDFLFAVDESQLLMFSPDGALIDKVSVGTLPISRIARVGTACGGLAIADHHRMIVTRDGVTWDGGCRDTAQWSHPVPPAPAQIAAIEPLLRPGVTWERLLQDTHSGRILGPWGPYFVDGIGVFLMGLALSGLWMFFREIRIRRRSPLR